MDFLKLIWVIPLFPAAGAVINGLLGKKLPKRLIDIVGCGLVGLAFIFALGAVNQLVHLPEHERHFEVELFTWIPAGMGELRSGGLAPFLIQWGFQLDPLSAVMVLVVTGIGFLIHITPRAIWHMKEATTVSLPTLTSSCFPCSPWCSPTTLC
jgi:NADH-quinone oxidoreductase subunit L